LGARQNPQGSYTVQTKAKEGRESRSVFWKKKVNSKGNREKTLREERKNKRLCNTNQFA